MTQFARIFDIAIAMVFVGMSLMVAGATAALGA
jgi:hypothetical protein